MDATRPRARRHPKLSKGRRGSRSARRRRTSAATAPQRNRSSASLRHGRLPASPSAPPHPHDLPSGAPQPHSHRLSSSAPPFTLPPTRPHPCMPSAGPQHGGSSAASPQRHRPSASPEHGGASASPQRQHRPSAPPAGSSRPAQPRRSGPGAGRLVWRRRRGGMALPQQCEAAFGTADLYGVLGVRRGASPQEIRRGYHRVSLRLHPDRVPPEEKEEATRRFQVLGKVYAVLSDEKQRVVYDETGTVDEDCEALQDGRDWLQYWRLLFKVTVKDIEDFHKNYKNSAEELADVKAAYLNFKGDMDRIMESVMCADYTDEPRIREMIEEAIDSGELPSFKAFVKESKQKRTARRRRSRCRDREKQMDNFFAQLEAKYGASAKKGGKKTSAKKRKAEGTA
ncbi:dnaJ homolog subfamily C member 9 isoform 2-T2 [Sylvia borin]